VHRHSPDQPKRDDGFTLVEVGTATLILGVVAAGVAGLVDVSVHALAHGRRQTTAIVLAQTVVERIEGGLSPASATTYFDASGRDVGAPAAGAVFVVRAATAVGAAGPLGWRRVEVTATPVAFDASRLAGPARLPEDVVIVRVLRGGS
jgi:prepilin-type N-terminal cleavage/methylation domain-containing protein